MIKTTLSVSESKYVQMDSFQGNERVHVQSEWHTEILLGWKLLCSGLIQTSPYVPTCSSGYSCVSFIILFTINQ